MCIRHISHWRPCHHQRCTGIDICSYAEAHPGLNPSDCPKGENVYREEAEGRECKICGERDRERSVRDGERRDGERRGHSKERHSESRESRAHSTEKHDERDASLESVSTVDSDSIERGGHHNDKSKGDDSQGKKDKKKDDESGSWDSTVSLMLNALAHAAS